MFLCRCEDYLISMQWYDECIITQQMKGDLKFRTYNSTGGCSEIDGSYVTC